MIQLHHHWRRMKRTSILPILTLALALPWACARAQSPATTAMKFSVLRAANSPVFVSAIYVDGKAIKDGISVAVGTRWEDHLVVELTNASSKTIVMESVAIFFPESGKNTPDSPLNVTTVVMGVPPPSAYRKTDGGPAPIPPLMRANPAIAVAHGGKLRFDFSGDRGRTLDAATSRAGKITQVLISLGTCYFYGWFSLVCRKI